MASIVRPGSDLTVRRPVPVPVASSPLAAFGRLPDGDRLDHAESALSALIRTEIVPRLVIAHAADRQFPGRTAAAPGAITAAEVEALAELSLDGDADALFGRIDAVLARGIAAEAVLVDLLAPTARLLGERWEADRCDFLDVTMALWRLQEVVRELAVRCPVDASHAGEAPSALFAAMPGDQHGFGTIVIDEIFRRDGWTTARMAETEVGDLLRCAATDWFDLVGLTVSCDCHIGDLPSLIVALRSVSRNPRVCIMVGGRVFGADPALARRVGADATAPDANLALTVASGLVRARRLEAVACS